MKVVHVPADHVAQIWPQVEGFIESALVHSHGEYTAEHAKVYLSLGTWKLIVASTDTDIIGCATVEFINRPNDRVALITAIGGRLISNKQSFADLKNILRHLGATKIEGAARESIARLWSRYGFAEKYRIVEVEI